MSSSDFAISIRDVSKKYLIAHETGGTVGDNSITARVRKGARGGRNREEFWALRNVSFDIGRGDVVGIIGRNGAGKSTLLKILSRITDPTTGVIEVYGRIGSLLEVGTGMHPELTGRENIFLNGAILGMRRAEIIAKFDEIVDFSGVEKFLDTPVKRYSSGMYVRLAFAVAAHLNPEILIVDEVLAVGDSEFQKKCLGKMKDVAAHGRTVLFVSHNLTAVASLCNRGVFLRSGEVVCDDNVNVAINAYTDSFRASAGSRTGNDLKPFGFRDINIVNLDDPNELEVICLQTPTRYAIEFNCVLPVSHDLNVGFTLVNDAEVCVASCSAQDTIEKLPSGAVRMRVELPVANLPSGNYRVEGAVWDTTKEYDQSDGLLFFSVLNRMSILNMKGNKPRGGTLIWSPWDIQAAGGEPLGGSYGGGDSRLLTDDGQEASLA